MLPTIRSLLLRRRLLPIVSATYRPLSVPRFFSSSGVGGGNDDSWSGKDISDGGGGGEVLPGFDWGEVSSWSTGLTKDHFDGEAVVGRQVGSQADGAPRARSPERAAVALIDEEDEMVRMLNEDNKGNKAFVDGWNERMMETYRLLKQVREPGTRGAYLKDSEKAEMYRLHKEDPETYTVERLAKDYRIMRQRVHAILWLKEMEEEEEKKLGKPLDDSVEILLDNFPE